MGLVSDAVDLWILRQKVSLIIGGIIVMCMSACSTYTETRYALSGKSTFATVTNTQSNSGGKGTWSVKYAFDDDDGAKRAEEDYGPERLAINGGGNSVMVQYIPGSLGDSRLAGHSDKWQMIPFFASVVVLTVVGWKFMREYNEHERRSARST